MANKELLNLIVNDIKALTSTDEVFGSPAMFKKVVSGLLNVEAYATIKTEVIDSLPTNKGKSDLVILWATKAVQYAHIEQFLIPGDRRVTINGNDYMIVEYDVRILNRIRNDDPTYSDLESRNVSFATTEPTSDPEPVSINTPVSEMVDPAELPSHNIESLNAQLSGGVPYVESVPAEEEEEEEDTLDLSKPEDLIYGVENFNDFSEDIQEFIVDYLETDIREKEEELRFVKEQLCSIVRVPEEVKPERTETRVKRSDRRDDRRNSRRDDRRDSRGDDRRGRDRRGERIDAPVRQGKHTAPKTQVGRMSLLKKLMKGGN